MRFTRSQELPARLDRAVRCVHDLARWGEWMAGARTWQVSGDGPFEVSTVLAAPRPLALRLQVARHDDGVSWELLEGDLSTVAGSLRVARAGNRSRATWSCEVRFGVVVPGALLRELEDEVVPRWLAGLADTLRKKPRR